MNKPVLILMAIVALSLAGAANQLWARGGGGFHGSGGFGGGFHGGDDFRGGDFRGGDFRGGDFHGYDGAGRDGGWGGDRFGANGYGGDRAPNRGDLNHFLGLPSDQGFHQLGR